MMGSAQAADEKPKEAAVGILQADGPNKKNLDAMVAMVENAFSWKMNHEECAQLLQDFCTALDRDDTLAPQKKQKCLQTLVQLVKQRTPSTGVGINYRSVEKDGLKVFFDRQGKPFIGSSKDSLKPLQKDDTSSWLPVDRRNCEITSSDIILSAQLLSILSRYADASVAPDFTEEQSDKWTEKPVVDDFQQLRSCAIGLFSVPLTERDAQEQEFEKCCCVLGAVSAQERVSKLQALMAVVSKTMPLTGEGSSEKFHTKDGQNIRVFFDDGGKPFKQTKVAVQEDKSGKPGRKSAVQESTLVQELSYDELQPRDAQSARFRSANIAMGHAVLSILQRHLDSPSVQKRGPAMAMPFRDV
jgi:hypothetical protein